MIRIPRPSVGYSSSKPATASQTVSASIVPATNYNQLTKMNLDTMLKDLGQFGRFQAFYFTLLLFPVILSGYRSTEYIFTTMNIPHRCRVPECESTSEPTQFSPGWLSGAVPFTKDKTPEVCLRYRPIHSNTDGNSTFCPADLFNPNATQTCDDWVFSEPARTIAHDFNLMCPPDYWKRTLISSLSVITSFIGLPFAGLISDRIGRKTVMVFATVFTAVMGVIRSFSASYKMMVVLELFDGVISSLVYDPAFLLVCRVGRKTVMVYGSVMTSLTGVIRSFSVSYEMLAGLELFDGVIGGAIYGPAFLLGIETLAPSKRLLGSLLVNVYFALGEVVLACVMWVVQDWRTMQRVF